jgi:hypothetical protein
MAQKNAATKALATAKLNQAKKGLSSLANLADYNPQRGEYGPKNVANINKNLQDAFDAENKAKDAYDKARDAHVAAQWDAWNFYQGAGESVIGQYGSSSDEYASLGYKKKTEYKKTAPGTKAKKTAAAKGSE